MDPQHAIARIREQFDPQFATMKDCVAAGRYLPALVLVYAAIDALAWLDRRDHAADVERDDFQSWVNAYLLTNANAWLRPVTATDLYAARCAILHSQVAASRLSRKGEAREIWYDLDLGKALVPLIGLQQREPLRIAIAGLVEATRGAYLAFVNDIERGEATCRRVEPRAAATLETVRILLPKPGEIPTALFDDEAAGPFQWVEETNDKGGPE